MGISRPPRHRFRLLLLACMNKGTFAPHILITAPSNVAVDNIVSRILEEGFLDGKEVKWYEVC